MLFEFQLHVVNFFQLVEEPGIDGCDFRQLLDGVALTNRIANVGETLRMRRDTPLGEGLRLDSLRAYSLASIESANAFEKRLFKGAADRHHFANGLHLRAE